MDILNRTLERVYEQFIALVATRNRRYVVVWYVICNMWLLAVVVESRKYCN